MLEYSTRNQRYSNDMFVWDVNLLSQQLVVHLHPLHLLVTLLQSLVILTQLSNVVACFGQNASFTLEIKQKWQMSLKSSTVHFLQ